MTTAEVQVDVRRWWALAAVATAQLMIGIDLTIMNIALPSVQRSLHMSDPTRQWVITLFALGYGGLLLLGGRMTDLLGRRRALLIGLTGFAAASALGGAATGPAMLLTGRALQGVAGALLTPAVLATLAASFPLPAERGKAFGIYGTAMGSASGLGVLVGGVLTEYLDWRWCMFVNLGFVAGALLGAIVFLRRDQAPTRPALDVPGIVLVSSGLFGLVFGFSHASTGGWLDTTTLGTVAAGAVLLAAFAYRQTQALSPVLPLRVVLDRNRGAAYLAIFMVGLGQFGMLLFVTYYCQRTLGFTAIQSGLAFLPWLAAFTTMSQVGSRVIAKRVGPRWTMAPGIAIAGVALIILSQLSVSSSYAADVLPALVLFGAGVGLTVAAAVNAATSVVEPGHAGAASAMVNTSQMIGASLGTALLNSLAVAAVASYLVAHVGQAQAAVQAATHSYDVVFMISAVIMLSGSVLVGALARGERPLGQEQ